MRKKSLKIAETLTATIPQKSYQRPTIPEKPTLTDEERAQIVSDFEEFARKIRDERREKEKNAVVEAKNFLEEARYLADTLPTRDVPNMTVTELSAIMKPSPIITKKLRKNTLPAASTKEIMPVMLRYIRELFRAGHGYYPD